MSKPQLGRPSLSHHHPPPRSHTDPAAGAVVKCQREGVLTDDADWSEFDLHRAFAVVGVGEQ